MTIHAVSANTISTISAVSLYLMAATAPAPADVAIASRGNFLTRADWAASTNFVSSDKTVSGAIYLPVSPIAVLTKHDPKNDILNKYRNKLDPKTFALFDKLAGSESLANSDSVDLVYYPDNER